MTSINIDDLVKRHTKIHFFGLGFIQVKTTEHERYHFYHRDVYSIMPEEEIHNHRYGFNAKILKGSMSQEIYKVDYDCTKRADYILKAVSCDPNLPAPEYESPTQIEKMFELHMVEGSSYFIPKTTFHKVIAAVDCISYIQREKPSEQFASVVSKFDAQKICPFSVKIEEAKLWEMVRAML